MNVLNTYFKFTRLQVYKFNKLYAPYLVQETNFLFKYIKESDYLQEKSLDLTDLASLILVVCKSLALVLEKSADFFVI